MKKCEFCNSEAYIPLYIKDNFDIVKCQNCNLIFVSNPPDNLSKYYEEDYYMGGNDLVFQNYFNEKDTRVQAFRYNVEQIKRIRPTGGKLLDIGCAAGFFLEAAKNDFDVEGIEFSEASSNYARTELKHKVTTGDLLQVNYPDNYFDIITMWDVVEHVEKPLSYLKEICRILKPGGLIAISTGDAGSVNAVVKQGQWELIAPPWHLYYYHRKVLVSKLEYLGFKIDHIETNGNLVGKGNKLFYNRITAYFTSLFKLGDIMTIYGTKALP